MLTELVFKNRNKEYGAYQLRKQYAETFKMAIYVSNTVFLIGILFLKINLTLKSLQRMLCLPGVAK